MTVRCNSNAASGQVHTPQLVRWAGLEATGTNHETSHATCKPPLAAAHSLKLCTLRLSRLLQ